MTGLLLATLTVATAAGGGAAPAAAIAAVDALHAALDAGDREAALAALDEGVIIFESGGAELSRDEYASHHLGGDMAFSQAVDTQVVDRLSGGSGEVAWVMTRSRATGTYREREIDSRTAETMLLRRGPDGWRIVHIHWSSRALKR